MNYINIIGNNWLIFTTLIILFFILVLIFITMRSYILKKCENNFKMAIDSLNLLIVKIDKFGKILSFNKNFSELFKFAHHNYLHDIVGNFGKMKLLELLTMIENGEAIRNFEIILTNKAKKVYHILFTATKNDTDNVDFIELIGFDITERINLEKKLTRYNMDLNTYKINLKHKNLMLKQTQKKLLENEKQIWSLAYTDHFTNIYNKTYFIKEVSVIVKQYHSMFALVLINIDNIERCNNVFGPNRTDEIIYDIGTRIFKMTRRDNLVAKLGTDEFAVVLLNMNYDEIIEYIEGLIELNILNVKHEGITMQVSVSAGISIYPNNGSNYNTLMKTASIALKHAKDNGKAQYFLFDEIMENELLKKMNMESSIRDGLYKDRFYLVYQPQYSMTTGNINGFEALLRLKDSDGTIIPPGQFIYIAEESNLIIPLGYWVIHQTCKFILRLHNRGITHLTVSVNVSVRQFLQEDFVENIKSILDKYHIEPKYLEIEITETSLMNLDQQNLSKINELRLYGINIAIDDFGTGYSSLLYFKKTSNISVLKIDREFVKDITLDNNIDIVNTIVFLSHKFNLKVVAEGVETVGQYKILSKIGCDIMQGYLGSKPIDEHLIYKNYNNLVNINNKII